MTATPTAERNAVIVARYRAGERQADLARDYGLSRERIRQVIRQVVGEPVERPCRHCGEPFTPLKDNIYYCTDDCASRAGNEGVTRRRRVAGVRPQAEYHEEQWNRTHCAHGHERNEENTYWYTNGKRACRACQRESARRYAALRRDNAVSA